MDVILLRVSGRGHVGLEQLESMGEKIGRLELQLRPLVFSWCARELRRLQVRWTSNKQETSKGLVG